MVLRYFPAYTSCIARTTLAPLVRRPAAGFGGAFVAGADAPVFAAGVLWKYEQAVTAKAAITIRERII
jgi:hypothetical protein